MTSPCSVKRISPSNVPGGWARIAWFARPPPRPTVPPRPWKKRSSTPACAPHLGEPGEPALERPVRREVAPVLRGVRVAEHDLGDPPAVHERAVQRLGQGLGHELGRPREVVHRLEERDDVERGLSLGEEADLLREEDRLEEVRERVAHRDDVGLDRLRADLAVRPADHAHRVERLLGLGARARADGEERARVRELAPEHRELARLVEGGVVVLGSPEPQELGHDALVDLGVLAQVERGEVEAEGVDALTKLGQAPALGELGGPRLVQRVGDEGEVLGELVGGPVATLPALGGRREPRLAPEEEAYERLLHVPGARARLDDRVVLRQALDALRREPRDLDRGGERAPELAEVGREPLEDEGAVLEERPARELGGDVGVPVAVAPDPRAVGDLGERGPRGQGAPRVEAEPGHDRQDRALEEVQRVADLLGHGEALVPQLVGEPELDEERVEPRLDEVGGVEAGVERGRPVEVVERERDGGELVEDRLALGLGGVRGERRHDGDALGGLLQRGLAPALAHPRGGVGDGFAPLRPLAVHADDLLLLGEVDQLEGQREEPREGAHEDGIVLALLGERAVGDRRPRRLGEPRERVARDEPPERAVEPLDVARETSGEPLGARVQS